MKESIKALLRCCGLEVHRLRQIRPGLPNRPIANVSSFLHDVKARGFKPRGIIDVGANEGAWTSRVLSVFPHTPVLMIEPQKEMSTRLEAIVEKNHGCCYINAGAGRVEGELVQTIWEDLAGSSFLPPIDQCALESGKQRKTRIVTIDGILKTHQGFHPDFVKLDIQGFELEALAGAETLFGRTELFIIETSLFAFMPQQPTARDVIAFMGERSYELYDITSYLRRPLDGALGQVDFAFAKAAGGFRKSNDW